MQSPFEQLAGVIVPGGRLRRAWPLQGGVSAQITALDIALPAGGSQKVVIRRHGPADLQRNPDIAADEFRLLEILAAAGLPVPRPHHVDLSCQVLPFPFIALEYVEGQPQPPAEDLPGAIRQMASTLVRIHGLDASGLTFLPAQRDRIGRWLAAQVDTADRPPAEGHAVEALRSAWQGHLPPVPRRPALLHGDYWPGNMLWRDGRLAAVIDWEDAQLGNPLGDLANSRLEIRWAYGVAAMEEFTSHYHSLAPIDGSALPQWDLVAALQVGPKIAAWGLDEATEKRMRAGHSEFLQDALARILRH